MKRLLLFFLLIGTVLSANAIDFYQLVKLGLPADAKPAKFYFKCYFFNQNEKPSQFDYEDSSLESGDDKFYFFVKPTPLKDEDFTHISLWIYDTQKNAVKEVFNQNDDEKKMAIPLKDENNFLEKINHKIEFNLNSGSNSKIKKLFPNLIPFNKK